MSEKEAMKAARLENLAKFAETRKLRQHMSEANMRRADIGNPRLNLVLGHVGDGCRPGVSVLLGVTLPCLNPQSIYIGARRV